MNYTRNAVYTEIVTHVRTVVPEVYCTGKYEPTPAQFPCLYLRELDRYPTRRGMQLDGLDEQVESTWEAQVSSNRVVGAFSEVETITDAVTARMREMFYRVVSQTPIDDGKTYTVITRYRRVIGGSDKIPRKGDDV